MSKQRETLVIPIAGVCNIQPMADVAFTPLALTLKRRPDVTVARPVVPVGLGILRPLEDVYDHLQDDIGRRIKEHRNRSVVLVGHSLGGILAKRELAYTQHNPASRVLGMVAAGAPFQGVGAIGIPPVLRDIAARITNFNHDTPALIPPQEGGPQVIQIGSYQDEIVPSGSATKRLEFGRHARHIFSWSLYGGTHVNKDGVTIHHGIIPVTHNGLLLMPSSVNVLADAVQNVASSTAQSPYPDIQASSSRLLAA